MPSSPLRAPKLRGRRANSVMAGNTGNTNFVYVVHGSNADQSGAMLCYNRNEVPRQKLQPVAPFDGTSYHCTAD